MAENNINNNCLKDLEKNRLCKSNLTDDLNKINEIYSKHIPNETLNLNILDEIDLN